MRAQHLIVVSIAATVGCAPKPAPVVEPAADTVAQQEPQLPSGVPPDLSQPLALNDKVASGVLDNGLRYFVRENKKPEKRAEFWLVINAGSVHEDDDQRGLAHFVEHMAFNGTLKFPKNELISKLQKLGVKFGPHINAYTSFDETVYKLSVPTDDPKAVALALEILSEWAANITFLPEDVDAERGVVLAEKRTRDGANMRMVQKLIEKVFAGTRYASRLPIGEPEILNKAPVEAFKRFYRDWYHPDNMAVVAVGDFDGASIEAEVKKRFAGLARAEAPRPAPASTLPTAQRLLHVATRDKELPMSAILFGRLMPRRSHASAADFRRDFIEIMVGMMMTMRLDEAKKKGEARYLMAAASPAPLVRAAEAFGFIAGVKPDEMREGFVDLLAEIERARRHGFTVSEYARAQKKLLARLESSAKEAAADKEKNGDLAAELVRHITTGEGMPGRQIELDLFRYFAQTVKLDELTPVLDDLMRAQDLVVVSIEPGGAVGVTRDQAVAELAMLPQKRLLAYTDQKSDAPLIATPPTPGAIVEEKHHAEVDVHEWKLSNGARVVLKSTQFAKDKILFRASSPGGMSLIPTAELAAVRKAATVTQRGGLGTMDSVTLEKALAGRDAKVTPYIDTHDEGMRGSSSVADVEVLFQLAHLAFVAPRKDERAFQVWRESELETTRLAGNSPEVRFRRQLLPVHWNDNPRSRAWAEDEVRRVDLGKAFSAYRDRIQDAGDFTFYLVGSFDLETIKPLVARYLASLPDNSRDETYKIHKWPAHNARQRLVQRDGANDRANLSIYFKREVDPDKLTPKERVAWSLFADALKLQLLDLFREQLGDTYTVGVSASFASRRHYAVASVQFSCATDRAKTLEQRALAEIRNAVRRGVGASYLEKVKRGAVRSLETSLERNLFWIRRLHEQYFDGQPLAEIPGTKAILESITAADVKNAAKRFLDPKKPIVGVLLPANNKK